MNRTSLPGFALALAVLVACLLALLLGGGLAAQQPQPGAALRPATTREPVQLALPQPTPAPQR